MELLKQLYQIYSPSGKEKGMSRFIKKQVKKIPNTKIVEDTTGNLYITKGNALSFPCIVAHMDQVHSVRSKDFMAIETEDIIFGYSPGLRRQENLGADDKNGIWIALKCLAKYPVIKLAFFVSEEIGCVGSSNAWMDFFTDCRYVIEPDRKGYKDTISHICWTVLCSDKFLKAIQNDSFGYEETEGLMTDIFVLKEKGLNISCINLSCGYYEPHTSYEFTVKHDLVNCLKFVQYIVENCIEVYPHIIDRWNKNQNFYGCYAYENEYEDALEEIFDALKRNDTLGVEDLVNMYSFYFPTLGKNDFEQIYLDYHETEQV